MKWLDKNVSKIEYSIDLDNLSNEIWLDVIGYDGYYQISNMGRLKSLEREIPNARGGGYRTLKEKIKKIDVHNKRNQVDCLYSVDSVNKVYNFPKQVALHFMDNYKNETFLELYSNKKLVPPNPVSELLHKMGYKKCSNCKDIKKHLNFCKSYRNRGVNNTCRDCSNKGYIKPS
jgi:hypothetical protein